MKNVEVMVEVSARHVHLTEEDIEKLFGKGHKLKPIRQLSQPSEFAAEEMLTIKNGDRKLENVRIIGPARKISQVELSKTDARNMKIENVPMKVNATGGEPEVEVIGSKGKIKAGVINAHRHMHISDQEAKKIGVKDRQMIKVKIGGERALIFENVIVRVKDSFRMAVHIDTDEGNAAGISGAGKGELVF